ncbi:hypothetical protein BJY24_004042 [Nocardia transvalensis]|uniref:Uncharacterized protein n=1 Tax=Nocardia transvalensis TaxID=37333 RepID=A0A7W9PFY2_9NOCA|nr:hypothetical protein [Nocardia transvalensis]MBB5915175.1 hypothetical protein [Nocardia transvalensis]
MAGVLCAGIAAGAGGVAAADPTVPAPNAVGPFTTQGETTGKAACEAASAASGTYSPCFPYPDDGSAIYPDLKYYYNPA